MILIDQGGATKGTEFEKRVLQLAVPKAQNVCHRQASDN
jgi:hypothetical protein